jgi:hypothetical protein
LLGYKPEQTTLKIIPKNQWLDFTTQENYKNSSGIYLPRNQTAIVQKQNQLSLFHEYFGHGLYCEQSLAGKKLVSLDKKLLREEKQEFQNKEFDLEKLQKFRDNNKTFQELEMLRTQNLLQYELFAIWTEYLLCKKFNLNNLFENKYDSFEKEDKEQTNKIINFSEQYGNLTTFYNFGLARKTTAKRVKKLLEDIYGIKTIKNSKLILLTGSKKLFSDIDLFASSNYLKPIKTKWLDLVSFNEKDFEKRIRLFEAQVTYPIMNGEFIAGNKKYLEQKKIQLKKQPITEKAIQHNLKLANEQKERAFNYPENSEERKIGLGYSKTYLINALALKKGERVFSK